MYIDSCLYSEFHNYIDIINQNKNLSDKNGYKKPNIENISRLKCLYSHEIPGICIHEYIDKIIKNIYSEETHIDGLIICIVILIKRIRYIININDYNIHRIVAILFMISQKIYDDKFYNNEYWAFICGVTLENMNTMELEILMCLEFNVFITHEEMLATVKSIKNLSNITQ